jgi:hypothetical protein
MWEIGLSGTVQLILENRARMKPAKTKQKNERDFNRKIPETKYV